jgi:cell wall-associated NlpC family hydrolase
VSDPRLNPDPKHVRLSEPAKVYVPVIDLCRSPAGARDRQLVFGEMVTVLNRVAGWAYVQAAKDGYCGYLKAEALSGPHDPTHWVSAAATHLYSSADFKSPDLLSLSFGSHVTVLETEERFARTEEGFIPLAHLSSVATSTKDPAEIAVLFLGTPYLWGGNSRWGIDCSGLIQAALLACDIDCPGDSDMQMALGTAAPEGDYRRNDLLFWKGHVALVTDPTTLVHANAGSMSTRYEGIDAAIARIAAQGDGPVLAHRRLSL